MNLLRRALRCSLVSTIAISALAAAATTWDFEDGTLNGWQRGYSAFANQPTYGNNVEPRRPGESPGQQGNYWIGTYENHPSPDAPYGAVQGDGPEGVMFSDPFTIATNRIDFLIGGGNDPDREYVSLLVKSQPGDPVPIRSQDVMTFEDGQYFRAFRETGRNDEHMRAAGWNVSQYLNRTARIQIVDASSDPWGHINVDDFRGIELTMPTEPDLPPQPVQQPRLKVGKTLTPQIQVPPQQARPPEGLGTATVVGPAQPPQGSGTAAPAQPPQSGTGAPAVVVSTEPGGDVVVQEPSNGRGSPMLVTPAGPPPREEEGVRRHYQLIALGFEVLRQTVDDMLERDGAGDEMQIRMTALNVDRDGQLLSDTSIRSGSFGAPDRTNFGAGTAEAGWSAEQRIGGLKTGDLYPRTDFDRQGLLNVKTNGDLPMVLWDGILEDRGNGVVLVPTMWELDSMSPQSAIRSWGSQLVYQARQHPQRIAAALTHVVSEQPAVDDDLFPQISIAIQGDRPIATAEQLPTVRIVDILLPIILVQRPAALDPKIIMKIPAIPLSFRRAEELSGRGPSMIRIRKPDGSTVTRYLPTGGFAVRYKDPDGMDGDYLLSLRLIRIDDQGRQE